MYDRNQTHAWMIVHDQKELTVVALNRFSHVTCKWKFACNSLVLTEAPRIFVKQAAFLPAKWLQKSHIPLSGFPESGIYHSQDRQDETNTTLRNENSAHCAELQSIWNILCTTYLFIKSNSCYQNLKLVGRSIYDLHMKQIGRQKGRYVGSWT